MENTLEEDILCIVKDKNFEKRKCKTITHKKPISKMNEQLSFELC